MQIWETEDPSYLALMMIEWDCLTSLHLSQDLPIDRPLATRKIEHNSGLLL